VEFYEIKHFINRTDVCTMLWLKNIPLVQWKEVTILRVNSQLSTVRRGELVHVEASYDICNAHTEGTHMYIDDSNLLRLTPETYTA
jgi:hypothetical protein